MDTQANQCLTSSNANDILETNNNSSNLNGNLPGALASNCKAAMHKDPESASHRCKNGLEISGGGGSGNPKSSS